MAQKQKPKDPFAMFSAAVELEGSDLDSEGEDNEAEEASDPSRTLDFISKPCVNDGNAESKKSLPTPKLDEKVANSFAERKINRDVDWDKIVRDDTKDQVVDTSNTNAMPPPKSYEPQTENLKPTIGDNTVPLSKRPNPDPGM